jgi:hypothetical protein
MTAPTPHRADTAGTVAGAASLPPTDCTVDAVAGWRQLLRSTEGLSPL